MAHGPLDSFLTQKISFNVAGKLSHKDTASGMATQIVFSPSETHLQKGLLVHESKQEVRKVVC